MLLRCCTTIALTILVWAARLLFACRIFTASRALISDSGGDIAVSGVTTTELDILDGLTASTAELNIMDGVTATTSELT